MSTSSTKGLHLIALLCTFLWDLLGLKPLGIDATIPTNELIELQGVQPHVDLFTWYPSSHLVMIDMAQF